MEKYQKEDFMLRRGGGFGRGKGGGGGGAMYTKETKEKGEISVLHP